MKDIFLLIQNYIRKVLTINLEINTKHNRNMLDLLTLEKFSLTFGLHNHHPVDPILLYLDNFSSEAFLLDSLALVDHLILLNIINIVDEYVPFFLFCLRFDGFLSICES